MEDLQRQKTLELADLCDIAPAVRDGAWARKFFETFPQAVLKGRSPQVLRGPDGFPYFALEIPEVGEKFQAFQPAEVIAHCVEKGFGIVLNPTEEPPDFVFPYGALWAYHARKDFYPPSEARGSGEKEERLEEGREVLVGAPSEEFFPTPARLAVATFLKYALGIEQPACFVLMDAKQKPERSLVFNVFPSSFESQEHFFGALRALGWFFPNDYVATAIDQDSELVKHFEPLPLPSE